MRHPNYPSTETLGSTQKALGTKQGRKWKLLEDLKSYQKDYVSTSGTLISK